ncbi:DNA polymerase beta superfamily protein [uncultured Methanobrevibacter sp.]|uniref:nucleotidyltransferase domain-containing protein n=1 Tax=uncultured Methanobrevibacter sp. TaxID=253161 RepID=UPI002614CA61|nr:nucleotidyltransferase domain-containing protein [uncultured Methanobrevibacter sp.]
MKKQIIHVLEEIEEIEGIEILYACEAGSRVWGFANEKSDYDVRFIYKNVNVSDYLSLKDTQDVIEYSGDDIDLVGWDIKKALELHYKNNPSLREWLISNQVYIDRGIAEIFKDLGDFDKDVLKNYYLSMAKSHWKRYCGLKYQDSKVKKYLYVIRCILSWNILDDGIYPPLSIQELLDHEHAKISEDNKLAVINLVDYLKYSADISENTNFKLNNYILSSFAAMRNSKSHCIKDFDSYDARFRELLLIVR